MMGEKLTGRALAEGEKLVDAASKEMTSTSSKLLLSAIILTLGMAIWRFDHHSDRLYQQMAPVNSFATLMMEPDRDERGFPQAKIVTWVKEAQDVSAQMKDVKRELGDLKLLNERILVLLEQQAKAKEKKN